MTKSKGNGDQPKPADKSSGGSGGKNPRHTQERSAASLDPGDDLPRSYGGETLFLVAQEPHWLFTYWDIDISKHPGGATFLRVLRGDGRTETEIEVPFETRNWYIPVQESGADYTVEIGYYRHEEWNTIARSAPARTPSERMSDSGDFQFATVPLHLSFQALLDNMQHVVHEGETLLQSLARLQRDGKLFPSVPDFVGMDSDQCAVLEAILGRAFLQELSSGGLSSEQVQTRIREALEEKLSSPGELSSRLTSPGGDSSLFGALAALSSGENFSSWPRSALSSWAAAALSSWMPTTKSGASSQSLTSWSGAGLSSWGPEQLASWMQAAQSSWREAALSSWNERALTSWSQGAESSWSGASETLSSPGLARDFFMHVNAEVIFYGGTDPAAKVTIDGKPIALSPDGTFRYHFIFPDGTYEIPIRATSPDGVETRQALLRFERGTQKSGTVCDSGQPPLDSPMGAQTQQD